MKVKISDYIAEFFASHGITTVFTVVGGGAMHMNHSFGHYPKIECIYNHHEQASSMAAEAYFRVNHRMAGLCVTSGPGAINAINGVAGAYQDSIPMIVVSGQCKSDLTVRKTGCSVRTLGPQEFDIISTLENCTKYADTLLHPEDVQYYLEKAFYTAMEGRPGPCWIEVPVDIQGAWVETDGLRHFYPQKVGQKTQEEIETFVAAVMEKYKESKRPVIYAGNGIRIANAVEQFRCLIKELDIPVVTCWDSIDLMATDDMNYIGRAGIMGDRPGNFAVQNSDLLIVIGSRLNTYQVGYQLESWARDAYVIVVDVDEKELKKPTIRVDYPICCDARVFIETFLKQLQRKKRVEALYEQWNEVCRNWKRKYPVIQARQILQKTPINVYHFIDQLSRNLPDGAITVVANGSASVVGSQTYYIKENDRFIMNCGMSSMGYDLPAAIGACVANDRKAVYCLAGDGSIQMNLQELQTIVSNDLPVKIIVINNQGYQQIRITQTNLFAGEFVGVGPDSMDLGFPDLGKIAGAYGIPYAKCNDKSVLMNKIGWLNKTEKYCLLEVCCDTKQFFEPKSATKRLENGELFSPPLEDLAPFLTREELEENMFIPLIDER